VLLLAALAVLLTAGTALAETTFSITGRGWGHGIGLSQYGAKGYADHGFKYDYIVKHYYPGTTLGTRSNPDIRVNVDAAKANRTSWTLRPGTLGQSLLIGGVTAPDTGQYTFTASGSTITVKRSNGTVWKTFPTYVAVTQTGSIGGRLVQVVNTSGPFNRTYVIYRASMRVNAASGKLKLVNAVPLESYLYGVVPRESPSSWHIEALKAQAVTARSYAYTSSYPMSGGGPKELYCTTMSQMYHGYGLGDRDPAKTVRHEAASSNSAVDATRGKVVLYDGWPVQTFFFSSSGGHTANLEEVWGPTSAHYWSDVRTAVSDPYESNSLAASWGSPILKTGTSISNSLGLAHPAAAIRLVRGTGDFVKTANITLEGGSAVSVTGDRFRSKLGLKSTKFWVAGGLQATRYQESDVRVAFSDAWQGARSTRLSGGGMRYSTTPGATSSAKFTGTQVALIGNKAPSYGDVRISLDGAPAQTVSLKSPGTSYGARVWSVAGLAATAHTVTFEVVGNGTVAFDALEVMGTLTQASLVRGPAAPTRVQDTATQLVYSGPWATGSSSKLSGGSMKYAGSRGAAVTFALTGTTFTLISNRAASYGNASVYIDGKMVGTAVMHSKATVYCTPVFRIAGLKSGVKHVVRIQALANDTIAIDALDFRGVLDVPPASTPTPPASGWTFGEETDPHLSWSGSWLTQRSSRLSGGAMRYTRRAGSAAWVPFTGTRVRLVSNRATSYGSMYVSVDGARSVKISLHSVGTSYSKVVWTSPVLSNGKHRVCVKAVGNGTVAVDRIDVLGSF